ncbi:helix-turn-helix transcriptional regulator [Paenibacillus filicis]|uniref:Helix-turn-helix transcriptional regulator n=1 Tax=Paenibacillus filicis TaxID=669464 RepID=A0ABU9DRJ7_9BACL
MNKRELTPLGAEVKKRLIDIGMTQGQLAEKIGTSDQYLNLILYGQRSGKKYLSKIMTELGIDPDTIRQPA